MTTTETPLFSGLPIKGDITYGEERKDQRPEEEFLAILQPVLDDPAITAVSWRQYTPYFNDGDPCVFRVYGLYVNATEEAEDDHEESEDYEFPDGKYIPNPDSNNHDGRGTWTYPFGKREIVPYRSGKIGAYSGPDEAQYDRLDALRHAIEGGEFDDVLLKKFGDHARVRVVPNDGIYVEFYEHD